MYCIYVTLYKTPARDRPLWIGLTRPLRPFGRRPENVLFAFFVFRHARKAYSVTTIVTVPRSRIKHVNHAAGGFPGRVFIFFENTRYLRANTRAAVICTSLSTLVSHPMLLSVFLKRSITFLFYSSFG